MYILYFYSLILRDDINCDYEKAGTVATGLYVCSKWRYNKTLQARKRAEQGIKMYGVGIKEGRMDKRVTNCKEKKENN